MCSVLVVLCRVWCEVNSRKVCLLDVVSIGVKVWISVVLKLCVFGLGRLVGR